MGRVTAPKTHEAQHPNSVPDHGIYRTYATDLHSSMESVALVFGVPTSGDGMGSTEGESS